MVFLVLLFFNVTILFERPGSYNLRYSLSLEGNEGANNDHDSHNGENRYPTLELYGIPWIITTVH